MRYFDRNRKRLTKKQFVRGTLSSSNGENEVTIENSAGLPLEGIRISGNTQQYVDADNPLSPEHPQVIENVNTPRNMFDESKVFDGKHLTETGTEAHNKYQRLSGYISVEPNTTYRLSNIYNEYYHHGGESYQNQYNRCACYTEDKTLISVLFNVGCPLKGQLNTLAFTTPENARYIRITEGLYANNTMLTEGDAVVPYVPFTNGSQVVLKGKNLVPDVYDVLFHIQAYANRLKRVEKNGRSCIYYICNTGRKYVIEGGYKENTQYTMSMDVLTGKDLFGSGTSTPILFFFYADGTRSQIRCDNKDWQHITFTSDEGKTVTSIGTVSYTNVEIWIDKDTFMLEESAVETDYEPYLHEEIAIPTSIDIEEKSVMIRLAGNEKMADRITVESDHVTYIQKWGQYNVTSEDVSNAYVTSGNSLITFPCDNTRNEGAVDYAAVNQECPPLCNMLKNCTPWLPEIAMFDFYPGENGNSVMIYLPDYTGEDVVTALKSAITEQGPLTIQYPLATPIEHDITDTDFGQALLNLVVPRTQSGVLRVESALPASGLEVEYYSMEKEDKVTLEVLCVSEVGEELKSTSHSVRKDSKYQVKAPLIDGYTPINESIFGVASEEAEIIFEYKEAEDATV